MKCDKRLLSILIVSLFGLIVFIVSVLCAAKTIELNAINIAVILVFFLILICISAALLHYITKDSKKASSKELLIRVKECFSEIEILGDKIIERLEHRQNILNDLKKEIQQCRDQGSLDSFLRFEQYHESTCRLWKKYIECVKKQCIVTQIDYTNEHIIFDEFCDYVGKASAILNKVNMFVDEFIIEAGNFNIIVANLGRERSIINELYDNYLKNDKLLRKYNHGFETVYRNCHSSIIKMRYCIKKEMKELVELSAIGVIVESITGDNASLAACNV